MSIFEPLNPHFEARVRESFARQNLMQTIGARLGEVSPGEVSVELPYRDDLTQQHGYIHAGVVTAIVDTACGFAAMSLMPPGAEVLSVEFKINLLAPARGERLVAHGQVVKRGRTLTVCEGRVMAVNQGQEKTVAAMLATMFTQRGDG